MLRILIPTDFSKNAMTAMRTGLLLAKSFGAEVVFMHAMSKPMVPATSPEEVYSSMFENDRRELHEKLRSTCQKLYEEVALRPSEVQKQVLVMTAPIPETILQVTASQSIDLVVMGAGGLNSMKNLLFGSNTLQLMDLTPVPLLVVPEAHEFKGFRQIFTIVRNKDLGYRDGLRLLARFTRNFGATVNFLVVQKAQDPLPHLSDIIGADALTEEFRALSHEVKGVQKDELIQNYIHQPQADLFVWLPRKRGFWSDSYTEELVEEVLSEHQLPILVIPLENHKVIS